jgi:hypothetical protein
VRFACAGYLFLTIGLATVEARQSDQSVEAIWRGLQKQQVSMDIPPIVAIPDERHRFGILTLETPDTRGEFVKVSVPVGDLTMRLARKISKARYHRRERKARETIEGELREFQAQSGKK